MAEFAAGVIALYIGGASVRVASKKVALVLLFWALIVGVGSFMHVTGGSWILSLVLTVICLIIGVKFAPR